MFLRRTNLKLLCSLLVILLGVVGPRTFVFAASLIEADKTSDDEVVERLDMAYLEADRVANMIASSQIQKLDRLAKTSGLKELRPFQHMLAFEIFYGIARHREMQSLMRQLIPSLANSAPHPAVIWVNSLQRKGNSRLMPLLGEVLQIESRIYRLTSSSLTGPESRHLRSALQEDMARGRLVLLDDFSEAYRNWAGTGQALFRSLTDEQIGDGLIVAFNDDPRVTPQSELPGSFTYVTPVFPAEANNSDCSHWLTSSSSIDVSSDMAFDPDFTKRPRGRLH